MVYIVLSVFLFLLYKHYDAKKNKEKAKKSFINVVTFILCLLSSIKHNAVGVDTYQYCLNFSDISSTSWTSILSDIYKFVIGEGFYISDPGYMLIEKIFSSFIDNFYVFTFFVAFVFLSSIGRLLYNETEDIFGCFLGYLFYVSLLFHNLPNNLYRQTLGMGIILWAFILIKQSQKKNIALLLIFIAITIHKSCFIALIWFVLYKKNWGIYLFWGALIICPVLFIVGQIFIDYLVILSSSDRYLTYLQSERDARPIFYIIEIIFFYIMAVFAYKKDKNISCDKAMLYGQIGLTMSTVGFLWLKSDLIRISYYFLIFGIFFVPYFYHRIKTSYDCLFRKVFLIGIFLLLLGRIVLDPPKYAFFWDNDIEYHDRYYRMKQI